MSKILLITGAGRGIGAATARLAAARGYDVAVNYLRDEKAANDVVSAVKAAGQRAVAIQGDVAIEANVARTFATIDKELGRLTHLVYNAGSTGGNSRLEAADTAMIRSVIELNVLGALMCAKAAIPRMSAKHGGPGGAIVMLSSVAATLGSAGEYVWYAASKGAVESITYGLSKELAGDGIRVNCVSPGASETRIHADAGTPDKLARVAPMIPMGRVGQPEESAEAVLFLLSNAASYISGTVLRVAGGR